MAILTCIYIFLMNKILFITMYVFYSIQKNFFSSFLFKVFKTNDYIYNIKTFNLKYDLIISEVYYYKNNCKYFSNILLKTNKKIDFSKIKDYESEYLLILFDNGEEEIDVTKYLNIINFYEYDFNFKIFNCKRTISNILKKQLVVQYLYSKKIILNKSLNFCIKGIKNDLNSIQEQNLEQIL